MKNSKELKEDVLGEMDESEEEESVSDNDPVGELSLKLYPANGNF